MKKVSIVNKFGPSGNAITGKSAKEVADFLSFNNIEVTYICLGAEYKSKGRGTNQKELQFKVKELRNYYKGRNSILRLLWGFIDGFRLWLASATHKADVVIVMTDPPLLFFWFQLLKLFSRRRLFYWTMDIYPDAFAAGNYIKPSNLLYRFFKSVMFGKMPEIVIALGEKQLKFLEEKFDGPLHNIVLPCGIIDSGNYNATGQLNNGKIIFGYGGNIGEAHDASFLIALVKQLDADKHQLILSMYGSKSAYVKHEIKNADVVKYKDFLDYNDIASIDVNVATILPEWNHIVVPSKAITAICCGSALLLNGTRETDSWNMLQDASWLIEPSDNYTAGIKSTIDNITRDLISLKKVKSKALAKELAKNKIKALHDILFAIQNDSQNI